MQRSLEPFSSIEAADKAGQRHGNHPARFSELPHERHAQKWAEIEVDPTCTRNQIDQLLGRNGHYAGDSDENSGRGTEPPH
jgi:hypothetical protein